MKLIKTSWPFLLAAAFHSAAFAQLAVRPGKWELTSVFKGVPFGDPNAGSSTVCMSASALADNPERALIEASPPPSNDGKKPAPPKCSYSDIHRDVMGKSNWAVACTNPTLNGVGAATQLTPNQLELTEKLEMKSVFGSRNIEHTVTAHRIGDCG